MDSHATKLSPISPDLFQAAVNGDIDGRYVLSAPFGRVNKAKKAASCLLSPQTGDQVLAVKTGPDVYILAVLERAESTEAVINLHGDTRISTKDGRLSIDADEGMTLSTPALLALCAKEVGLGGEVLTGAFEKAELISGAVTAQLTDVKLFSKQLRCKIDSAIHAFNSRHVKVEHIDTLSAGSIKQSAQNLLKLQSAFAFLKAKKNVKIDGKQIFMG